MSSSGLNRFPDWDLERKNKVMGGAALCSAVYMGPRRLELVKVLLEHGASLDYRTHTGSIDLHHSMFNEDAILNYSIFFSKEKSETSVNYRRRGDTLKWRNIYQTCSIPRSKQI